ncbi:uncharacterized protein LOC131628769 [Vicia villosa]|uniref:uncharacterized protein LOC131628769 n=1 Tax=Vicia villosa TaxID=3911 RepID=UPI00273AF2D1|nr:uncharacterized protein LOC131628769 [Vicia villosa]
MSAQIWVRFFGLPQEYWRPQILFAITSSVGTPICIDSAASKSRVERTFGYFVRVLVDMDLSQPLNHNVLVEREGFAFFTDISYENLPEFCFHCRKTGHNSIDCKLLHKMPQAVAKPSKPIPQKTTTPVILQDPSFVPDPVPVVPYGDVLQHPYTSQVGAEGGVAVDGPPDPVLVEDPHAPQPIPNFISQLSQDSNTQLSVFVDATPEFDSIAEVPETIDKNRIFLKNSWDALSLDVAEPSAPAFSIVYAATNQAKRKDLWHHLSFLQSTHNLPWSFLGDFNTIIGAHEHRGRNSPVKGPMSDFKTWSDINNLVHVPTKGSFFTWSNKRNDPFFIERRLDRCICNHLWLVSCASTTVSTLTKLCSDHFPILLEFHNNHPKVVSQFKFLKAWTLHQGCRPLIEEVWKQKILGCLMFVLSRKLQILKSSLKSWNYSTFGNVTSNVKLAEENLHNIQSLLQASGNNDGLRAQELDAQTTLSKALDIENCFWREKSRIKWSLEGDRNTAFFHRITKIKKTPLNLSPFSKMETSP